MRRLAVVLGVGVLVALAAPFGAARAAPAPAADTVTITVTDISRSTPIPDVKRLRPLVFSLTVTNTGTSALDEVAISADRVDPIEDSEPGALNADSEPVAAEKALENAVVGKPAITDGLVSPVDGDPVVVDLPAGQSVPVTFATTTSTDASKSPGICLCADAIYPLVFRATYTDPDGTATVVGSGTTVIPSFGKTPQPAALRVSWVWPLLDRPHRLNSVRLFLDDDLTTEVADGGRLDRALRVVERVTPRVPMTLVVDPDLLDELEVMASGNYRVFAASAPGRSVPGTGAVVAQAWLDRFRTLLTAHPELDVELTPFADPDVDTLTAGDIDWTAALSDPGSAARQDDALAGRAPQSGFAWPVGGTLSQTTLTDLVQRGTQDVLLTDRTLPGGRTDITRNAISKIKTAAGEATAVVASTALQRSVSAILEPDGRGLGALPELVARLALRVVTSTGTPHYVVLTPPRELDVDPDLATRAILATADQFWSTPITVAAATSATDIAPSSRGALRPQKRGEVVAPGTLAAIGSAQRTLPGLTGPDGLFAFATANGTAAQSTTVMTVGKIPTALQRTASCELLDDPKRTEYQANLLSDYIDQVRGAVHLVQPAGNASYTLTSNKAPLPVTVTNPLDIAVEVKIGVLAEGNRPGLSASTKTVLVDANSTQQKRIPTSVDITGRINVLVTLSTTAAKPMSLASPLRLSVRNTAVGEVGVAITTVAAIVLALALLFRLYRAIRWRRRRATSPAVAETDPLAP